MIQEWHHAMTGPDGVADYLEHQGKRGEQSVTSDSPGRNVGPLASRIA
jgi:hypothetical protein